MDFQCDLLFIPFVVRPSASFSRNCVNHGFFFAFTVDFFFNCKSLMIIHFVAWKLAASGSFSIQYNLVNLIAEPVDAVYNLKFGRDWFNYCPTIPNAAFG